MKGLFLGLRVCEGDNKCYLKISAGANGDQRVALFPFQKGQCERTNTANFQSGKHWNNSQKYRSRYLIYGYYSKYIYICRDS